MWTLLWVPTCLLAPMQIDAEPTPVKIDERFVKAERQLVAKLTKVGYDDESGEGLLQLKPRSRGHLHSSVAFSPKAGLIATGSDRGIVLWDHATGKELRELPGSSPQVHGRTLAFSHDGTLLASLDKHSLRIHKVENGELVKELPTEVIGWHVSFSSDGSTLTTVTADSVGAAPVFLTTYSAKTFTRRSRTTITNARQTLPFTVSPSGRYFVHFAQFNAEYFGKSKSIVVLDLVTGREKTFPVPFDTQSALVSWDDRTLFCIGWKDILKFRNEEFFTMDLKSGELNTVATFKDAERQLIDITTDGKFVLMRGTPYGKNGASLVETASGKDRWSTSWYPRLVVSPGGRLLAGYIKGGGIGLFALEDMLHPKWADLGAELALARQKIGETDLRGDRVTVRVRSGIAGIKELVKTLPATTHLEAYGVEGLTEESIAGLKQLADLRELSFSGARGFDEGCLRTIGKLKSLRRLNLSFIQTIADDGLEALKGLEMLESLDLSQVKSITDAGMKHLGDMKSLRRLTLPLLDKVTEKGMAELSRLDLVELKLPRHQGKMSWLKHLGPCANLEALHGGGAGKFDDEDLKALGRMTKLRRLHVGEVQALDDAGLAVLKTLTELRSVDLSYDRRLTDAGLKHLEGLTNLETLSLFSPAITSQGLTSLKGLKNLTALRLQSPKIDDAGLEHLTGLERLATLELSNTAVRGEGLKHLKDCRDLVDLDLSRVRIVADGLAGLHGMKHLRSLKLPETIGDVALEKLGELATLDRLELTGATGVKGPGLTRLKTAAPRLRILVLSRTGLDDKGVSVLEDLPQLREVYLNGTSVTAESWPVLKKLSRLHSLGLPKHASIKSESVQELRKALPKTWVQE